MRPLVTFFIFALIAAQFEYITDTSAFLADHAPGDTSVVFNLPDTDPGHEQNHDGCDHCCHGASHMTALAASALIITTASTAHYQSAVPVNRISWRNRHPFVLQSSDQAFTERRQAFITAC